MDNEQSESSEGGEAQRVDVTFPQMSIMMSHKHTQTHCCKSCHSTLEADCMPMV